MINVSIWSWTYVYDCLTLKLVLLTNITFLYVCLRSCICAVAMADANINAPEVPTTAASPPTQSDEQILPRNKWVPVGKSNCFLDVEKSQANPIFKIVVDILKNTNFFKAFTASSTIPSIYIQQFWDTIRFDKDKGYNCQLDEQRFYLTKATLRDALQLPQDNNNFTSPPNANTIISFVNELGYPNVVRTLSGVVTNDMYQPWRALTTIINLCLTGKTSAFERPRAPVLQILWGVVNKANIDYAERIWEEFTQCIHSFIEDKMNLALHTEGKKKVNPLVIPGVRFTKLIINHLQSIHKFHKRPGSPLHLPYEEAALGYLKFSFKNTKRRYLAGEVVSDDEAPAPKPGKGAKPKTPRKPKPQSTSSQPPKPKPAPAKPQEKKRKLVMETTGAPSPAKRSKADEGVPADEPRFKDEETDIIQKVMEESLKDAYPAPRGLLPPVVIRESEPGKYEPLPEVHGKGKEKVGEEQAAQVLLNLQTPKKKNPAEQFIFQRRTPTPTIPSSHEESSSLYVELGLTDSESESDNEASHEGQAGSDPRKLVEGQAGSDPGVAADSRIQPSHVVHAGPNLEHINIEVSDTSPQPNPEQMDEEFTTTIYPSVQENLKLPTEGEVRLEEPASSNGTLSSLQNLDKDLSFTNQFLAEKSQPDEPEKTNNETEVQYMVTVPIHQDTSSVPLMTTPVIDLTVSQLASTTIQASIPTSTATRIGELEQHMAYLVEENQALEERLDKQGHRMYQLENQDLSGMIKEQTKEYMRTQEIDRKINETVKKAVTASIQYAMRAPIRARFKDLPTSNMKEIMLEENYDKGHEDHRMACEALQTSILRDESEQFDADKSEERKKMKSKQDSPKTPPRSPSLPPPPPPPSSASGASDTTRASDSAQDPLPPPPSPTPNLDNQSPGSAAPGSSKTSATTAYTAWTTTTSRFEPFASSIPEDVFMHEESDFAAPDMVSDDEDIGIRHIPIHNLKQDWFKPLSEDERLATPEPACYVPPLENSLLSQTGDIRVFIDWFCKKQGIIELTPKHLEGPAYEVVKAFHPDVIHLQYQIEECHKLLTNQVDDRRLSKGDRIALSIRKMKAAYYPDVGLEQMVPDQMWIEVECMYDIFRTYGISHWWFRRQKFYIDRHSAETNRRAIVWTHMRILSVVSIDVFLIYGYDYMKQIVLRRSDNQEYTITENDFKDLYPSDFEDMYLLNLQGHLNHLPPRDRKILSSAVNLWIRNLEATGLEFMHDYKILDSPRDVLFRDKYGTQMLMRFNEIHKFSDGTLQQIDEALDYQVKEFKVNKNNPALNTRFWTTNDVIKCKQFMFAIQKRLKLERIFRNLESFVDGRIREGDYRLLRRTE
ncbi:hypothetical protein Tco_0083764 [Tanacetum coccineum]